MPEASSLHVPVLSSQRYAGAGVGGGVGGVGGAVPWQSLSVIGTQLLPLYFVHCAVAPAGHGHAKLFVAGSWRR